MNFGQNTYFMSVLLYIGLPTLLIWLDKYKVLRKEKKTLFLSVLACFSLLFIIHNVGAYLKSWDYGVGEIWGPRFLFLPVEEYLVMLLGPFGVVSFILGFSKEKPVVSEE